MFETDNKEKNNKGSLSLNYEATIDNVEDLNSSFAKAVCCVCYAGINQNGSSISLDSLKNALPTIKNIPIVARYDETNNKFGSHDVTVKVGPDGKLTTVKLTTPYGLVPESGKQWFEDREVNGETKTCLFTDVLLWKRQYGYEHIKDVGEISESMEINVDDYSIDDNNIVDIKSFEFTALCLLESADPCFENAELKVFSKDSEFSKQYETMMNEFKELDENKEPDNKEPNDANFEKQGGNEMPKDLKKQADADNKTTNFEDLAREKSAEFSTYNQLYDALDSIVTSEYDNDHFIDRYLMDFDENSVYVSEYWGVYATNESGHRYTKQGYAKVNGDYALTGDPVEVVKAFVTKDELDLIQNNAKSEISKQFAELSEEFKKYKDEYSKEEFESLKDFKAQKDAEERKNGEDAIYGEFKAVLGDSEDFTKLWDKRAEFSINDLKKECASLYGMKLIKEAKFEKEHKDEPKTEKKEETNFSKAPIAPIDNKDDDAEKTYGGILKHFSK